MFRRRRTIRSFSTLSYTTLPSPWTTQRRRPWAPCPVLLRRWLAARLTLLSLTASDASGISAWSAEIDGDLGFRVWREPATSFVSRVRTFLRRR
jgi:hypothetical protein